MGEALYSAIFDPLEEFKSKYRALHGDNTEKFFTELVARSGVNVEENRETVRQYRQYKEDLVKLRKKLNWLRFFRVLMIITILLIPLVIWKMTPKIRALRDDIAAADQKAEELLSLAGQQMLPLNALFTDRDALEIICQTIPLISFDPCYTVQKEEDMRVNYDFAETDDDEQSATETLSGSYNENPFLFENKLVHTMGTETYHGYKTISWTESYVDSSGRRCHRTRTERLHAQVVKPKPYYSTQVVLNYGAQGAADLCFSRDASHLEQKSDKAIERIVKRGEKKLKKRADRALRQNDDFTSMANTDFEVLFDALDRTDELQFRTLFTPLAQTNMVALIRSKDGFGDDFNFFKNRRMNRIVTNHSQGRLINLSPEEYRSYDFDEIREAFLTKNADFFKALYFDFAPIWAIPAYQERPVHSLMPIPELSRLYSAKEGEVLANRVEAQYVVHPKTKTPAILKTGYVKTSGKVDETRIKAYSYDIEKRVDIVSVYGGDGRWHDVPVPWDEYLPLKAENSFFITTSDSGIPDKILASKNGLCIMKS